MTERVTVEPVSMREVMLVRLSGDVTAETLNPVAETLRAATARLAPPHMLAIDLRELATLSAAGLRMVHDLARSATDRGLRCCLVIDPTSTLARVAKVADPDAIVPRFADLDEALALPVTVPRDIDRPGGADDDQISDADPLLAQFEALTRTLLNTTTVGAALRQVLAASALVVSRADLVSVTLRAPDGAFSTPVETDPNATDLDQIQYRSGRGPCLDAARPDAPGYAVSDDLSTEHRWPDFAAAATGYGYRTILSTELFPPAGPGRVSGALNIYSRQPGGFTAADRQAAFLLATHASLALAHAHSAEIADVRQAQLRQAIDTRDVIGQAKGILMGRQGITAEDAFTLLRTTSQELNVKLVDLARSITDRQAELDPRETPPPA